MSLIIAIVLIVIIGIKVLGDKANSWSYEVERKRQDDVVARFNEEYVNDSLNHAIWELFEDTKNLPQIHEEVNAAFNQMPHWKGTVLLLHPSEFFYKNGRFTQKAYKENCSIMQKDRRIAVDIILANRGYISITAAECGYEAYTHTRNTLEAQKVKECQYELVCWIRDTLEKQSIHVEPVIRESSVYGLENYGWRGSRYTSSNIHTYLPLNHSLIELPSQVTIPKPYYDNSSSDNKDG